MAGKITEIFDQSVFDQLDLLIEKLEKANYLCDSIKRKMAAIKLNQSEETN